nr:tetratricopeptide repeat protein [uncultured Bacteroides sp.]
MLKKLLATILLAIGIASSINAQFPSHSRGNTIMQQFDVSSDGKLLGYQWIGKNGISRICITDVSTQKTEVVASVNMKTENADRWFSGVAFLSAKFIYHIDKELFSYDWQTHIKTKLFNLPAEMYPSQLTVPENEKGIYVHSPDLKIMYYIDLEGNIKNKITVEPIVLHTAATMDGQIIYSVLVDKAKAEIWRWDGQNPPVNITGTFADIIDCPMFVEQGTNNQTYIVMGRKGVFLLNAATKECFKLIDVTPEAPIFGMRFDRKKQLLYYLPFYDRHSIRTVNIEGKQSTAPVIKTIYDPAAIAKNNEAVRLYWHRDSIEKAFRLLDEAIAIDSTYILAYGNKVSWLDKLGRQEEALEMVDKVQKYIPNDPLWYGQRGILLYKLNRPEEAHAEFLQALQLLEKKMKDVPTVNDFFNYLFIKRTVDGKELSNKEIEDLIPTSFTEKERQDVELRLKYTNPTQIKISEINK